jgi:hypothetical protein
MDWPYKFPHPWDVIAREAERYRRLSAEERINEIVELFEVGRRLLQASPNRDAILAQYEASERAWQEAHRRVFGNATLSEPIPRAPRLLTGLAALVDAFERHDVRYALIGTFAAAFYAGAKFTAAIEILLTVSETNLPGLVATLAAGGFTVDQRAAVEEFVRDHMTTFEYHGVRVDWLKPVLPLYHHVLDRVAPHRLDSREYRVATPEGLILLKVITSDAQDIADIHALLTANQGRLDLDWVEKEWLTLFPTDDPRWIRFRQKVAECYGHPCPA